MCSIVTTNKIGFYLLIHKLKIRFHINRHKIQLKKRIIFFTNHNNLFYQNIPIFYISIKCNESLKYYFIPCLNCQNSSTGIKHKQNLQKQTQNYSIELLSQVISYL